MKFSKLTDRISDLGSDKWLLHLEARKLKKNNPQILHYTYFNEKKFFKTKAKIVTTEYDLIKEIFYKHVIQSKPI